MNTNFVWHDQSVVGSLVRAPLVPPSLVYRSITALRAAAYRYRVLPKQQLPVPVISVGNLAAGGTGKTPLANWIAQWYANRGVTPGVVLRGYGGDETPIHEDRAPDAIVEQHADRTRAIRRAAQRGAQVAIMDDGFQRLDVERDLDLVLVSAETPLGAWTLPAGPWREGRGALARADVIVVTRRLASPSEADAMACELMRVGPPVAVVSLECTTLRPAAGGDSMPLEILATRRVLSVAGVGKPEAFHAACLRASGHCIHLTFGDHHRYTPGDLNSMLQASQGVDYVVTTEKDAVKLRSRWPENAPQLLVARLHVRWESGAELIEGKLTEALQPGG